MRAVDADKVYNMLDEIGGCGAKPDTWEAGWDEAINTAIELLEGIPTIVPDIPHGTWEEVDSGGLFRCSNCHDCYTEYGVEKYCKNCGAKMDGGGNSEPD